MPTHNVWDSALLPVVQSYKRRKTRPIEVANKKLVLSANDIKVVYDKLLSYAHTSKIGVGQCVTGERPLHSGCVLCS
jgi:hypothetical protein